MKKSDIVPDLSKERFGIKKNEKRNYFEIVERRYSEYGDYDVELPEHGQYSDLKEAGRAFRKAGFNKPLSVKIDKKLRKFFGI
jgi:hypothetical protein